MKDYPFFLGFLREYFPLSEIEDYHTLADYCTEEDYGTVLELADRIDEVLGLYSKTASDMFRAENGQEVFRVKERGIAYPNTPVHYDILCDIEGKTLKDVTIIPVSEIAKQKITLEIIDEIKLELGF